MRTWGGELKITVFSEHFNINIRVYRYATSIVLNHEYIHPNSNLTVRFYFLNEDYYNLFKNIELNNKANLNQINKEEMKQICKVYTQHQQVESKFYGRRNVCCWKEIWGHLRILLRRFKILLNILTKYPIIKQK